jgi:hypothetical protein
MTKSTATKRTSGEDPNLFRLLYPGSPPRSTPCAPTRPGGFNGISHLYCSTPACATFVPQDREYRSYHLLDVRNSARRILRSILNSNCQDYG